MRFPIKLRFSVLSLLGGLGGSGSLGSGLSGGSLSGSSLLGGFSLDGFLGSLFFSSLLKEGSLLFSSDLFDELVVSISLLLGVGKSFLLFSLMRSRIRKIE